MGEIANQVLSKAVQAGSEITKNMVQITEKTVKEAQEVTEAAYDEIASNNAIVLEPNMEKIKEQPLSSVIAMNNELSINTDINAESASLEKLTMEQRTIIVTETGWPSEIVCCIDSMKQYEIYKKAELKYVEINGRPCLVKDIDMNYVSPRTVDAKNPEGLTNMQLMEKGRAPYDSLTDEQIELHHMGQDFESPLAELCENSEHGDGNDAVLHDKRIESWRRDPILKNRYNNIDRPNHWKNRVQG